MMVVSFNFAFLAVHDPQLVRLGALAEQYFTSDPNTCLIKLRQFGELLAQLVAAEVGLYVSPDERQIDLLRRLKDRGLLKSVDGSFRHTASLVFNSMISPSIFPFYTLLLVMLLVARFKVF